VTDCGRGPTSQDANVPICGHSGKLTGAFGPAVSTFPEAPSIVGKRSLERRINAYWSGLRHVVTPLGRKTRIPRC
jgi:hypothetical protein